MARKILQKVMELSAFSCKRLKNSLRKLLPTAWDQFLSEQLDFSVKLPMVNTKGLYLQAAHVAVD